MPSPRPVGRRTAQPAARKRSPTAAPPSGQGAQRLPGAGADQPPGAAAAARDTALETLTEQECRSLLSTHGVGRVSVATDRGPVIVPVNYLVFGEALAYRTTPAGVLALAEGEQIAFETDHIDDVWRQGWSVNVTGRARAVSRAEARALDDRAYALPLAGGNRRHWVVVVPDRVTGRRVHAG
ncbi:pyridoxamine 5'-phosphate oxidase family protein [Streptomyces sp. NPDC047002]|uniref:pyridoxamine 5'-phosphate oxidase family protein n=1 Tax=Streptomyces sp. NPDC047002 TaxID=3155475 RepID=UPI0034533F00